MTTPSRFHWVSLGSAPLPTKPDCWPLSLPATLTRSTMTPGIVVDTAQGSRDCGTCERSSLARVGAEEGDGEQQEGEEEANGWCHELPLLPARGGRNRETLGPTEKMSSILSRTCTDSKARARLPHRASPLFQSFRGRDRRW